MAITLDGTNGINSSGVIVAPDGSASAPSITNDGDTNTGIYFPAADNIGFATNGVIRGRWTTDGLCFGSDTAAANALDDYEEGTWTPRIDSGTNGSGRVMSGTGVYTKIGDIVKASADVTITTLGTGGSGRWVVEGFPFAAGNPDAGSVGFFSNLNANVVFISLFMNNSATRCFMTLCTAGTANIIDAPDFATYVKVNTRVIFNVTYKVS